MASRKPAFLVDINVFVDISVERLGWIESFQVANGVLEGNYEGYVSALTVPILYFRRKRVRRNEKEARNDVYKMIDKFKIVDMDTDVLEKAKDDSKFSDFEDAIQYYPAKPKRDDIITRNRKDFPHRDPEALSPEDFLKKHRS